VKPLLSVVVLVLALSALVLMLVGGTTAGAAPTPAKCSPADTRREATLATGAFRRGGTAYATFCGPGEAVVRLGGRSFTIQGGHCGRSESLRLVTFGVIANGPLYPGATGISILLKPGEQPGRVNVIDSIIQAAGLDLSPTGTAVVAKGLNSGTFSLATRGSVQTHVTGIWTCG
jgi:hypothetical protein